jgi:hypothetical protein
VSGVPVEVVAVWLLFAAVTVEILVTYARLPAAQLYHVSGTGGEGGASRALVFLNFPFALVAIALLTLLSERLPDGLLRGVAVCAAVLCLAVVWPGVVDQRDLDAKPVNAIAAAGVLLTLALTLVVGRGGVTGRARRPGDAARAVAAAAVVVLASPWIAADLGFFLDGVPVLGSLFQTGKRLREAPGLPEFPPAVHLGHHHGMDGALLVLTALLLSRAVPELRARALRIALAAYLALMACYGLGNIANDFWIEQVWKRGWTAWLVPDVLRPRASAAWGVILGAALLLLAVARSRRRIRFRRASTSPSSGNYKLICRAFAVLDPFLTPPGPHAEKTWRAFPTR